MTCIVGIVEHGIVIIGGDSAGSADQLITIHTDRKVFRNIHNDQCIIGCCDSFRLAQLLQYELVPPPIPDGKGFEHYMVVDFVDAVRACLKKGGYAKKKHKKEIGGALMVGFHGHLVVIHEDYQVKQSPDNFFAMGSGAKVAIGVLAATKDLELSPLRRVTLALEAAEYHIEAVRRPFIIEQIEENTCQA